ncbi:App1 family protein [Salinimicrobium oceani]|uniref:App1 family protein n=1 Tax=Salinimicrobium oceani TaxID=2722702 RepID=A0ABX1CWZ2_9FLAO|nr:App1 family protein [Salinimicrobium oceani]NJW52806.1 App1 family protein [Salinimicrobium oceani]
MKLDIKLYRGYVNDQELVVFGHVFDSWAPDKYEIDRKGYRHAKSVYKMFTINPITNARVKLKFKDLEVETKTTDDGYFRFNLPYNKFLDSGWHPYTVSCKIGEMGIIEKGEVLKPFKSKLGIISDIDDTFLISHTNNFFKKLYVILTQNINNREIFNDVVPHYQALSRAGQEENGQFNSFFYVSSSEWNLYEFILQLTRKHKLPKAVIKLKSIKTGLGDFLFTGRGGHDHKFIKIKDIISFYPQLQYVLLGDDSQQDPHLYERVAKIFPMNVRAIYIRQTSRKQKPKVKSTLENIEDLGVATCYFKDSTTAIAHSKKIGIV